MRDSYITECINNKCNVVVYVTNGFQLRGSIVEDCGDSIVIKSNGKKKLIFKNAISTIEPV